MHRCPFWLIWLKHRRLVYLVVQSTTAIYFPKKDTYAWVVWGWKASKETCTLYVAQGLPCHVWNWPLITEPWALGPALGVGQNGFLPSCGLI